MKVELNHIQLNRGGYTNHGEYYGTGAPLYEYRLELPDSFTCYHLNGCSQPDVTDKLRCVECNAGVRKHLNDVCEVIRASDRDNAKAIVRRTYPDAAFYR